MSKEAGLRAMREARYASRTSGTPAVRLSAPVAPPASTKAPAAEGLCGHRSMNGRTCTRDAGHAAKSHRYG